MDITTEIVGWVSALLLALTISRQVYTQWRTKSVGGVSKWLFIGQLAASAGFTWYSWLVQNWVFVATNTFMVLTALAGEAIYLTNRRRAQREQGGASASVSVSTTGRTAASSSASSATPATSSISSR